MWQFDILFGVQLINEDNYFRIDTTGMNEKEIIKLESILEEIENEHKENLENERTRK